MTRARAMRGNERAWGRGIVLCAVAGALAACGGEVSVGRSPPPVVRADAGATATDALVAAHWGDTSAPPADTGAPAADQLAALPPGCPQPAQIAGSYAGSFSGTLKAFLPIPLSGTISFDVLPQGGAVLPMANGKVHVTVLGMVFDLEMNGEINCGKMLGKGSATIAGVQFSGAFLGQWQDDAFPGGSWSGKDVNETEGSGSWKATRK